ncbi:hypothetical protein [Enterococcus faecium]|uniref:hypothetical protein n=1 Tax=Enterococcus faecium TaxID=1352 RepID=UPI00241430CA|nr:hypothetical protein [Enterococcus faecium]MDG4588541.1 hypothetical protein [Enterococcus faecium]
MTLDSSNPNNQWKRKLMINRALFPDSFSSVIEILFYTTYLNLSFLEFSTITSIIIVLSSLLEIPSGIISDWIGRKRCLLIGSVVDVFCAFLVLLIPIFSLDNVFVAVLCIEIIQISGQCLASGNFEVLVYEMMLDSSSKEEEFKIESARYFSFGSLISAFSGLVSTVLWGLAPVIPLIVDNVIKLVKISTFISLPQKKSPFHPEEISKVKKINSTNNIWSIIFVIIFFSVLFSVSRVTFSLYQPITDELSIPLTLYGLITMLINISVYVITKWGKKLISNIKIAKITIIAILVLILQSLSYSLLNIENSFFRFTLITIFFSSMQIIRIASEGLSSYYLNNTLKDQKNKIFFFSLYQTIASALCSIFFVLIGLYQNKLDSYLLTYILFCITISLILFFLIFWERRVFRND